MDSINTRSRNTARNIDTVAIRPRTATQDRTVCGCVKLFVFKYVGGQREYEIIHAKMMESIGELIFI